MTSKIESVLRRAIDLMQAGEIEAWLGLCSDDVVLEFPFAPPPRPRRVQGKEAIGALLDGRRLAAPRVEDLVLHECVAPDTVIAEMTVRGASGPDRSAIAVVQIRDGLITLYRDYWNPLDVTDTDDPVPVSPEASRRPSWRHS
jgi:uncharacterized protein